MVELESTKGPAKKKHESKHEPHELGSIGPAHKADLIHLPGLQSIPKELTLEERVTALEQLFLVHTDQFNALLRQLNGQ